MKIILSETHKKIVFHLFLWSIWLFLSLTNVAEEDIYNRAILVTTLIVFTHIPLFCINTELLIPKILHKKGIVFYLLALIATVVVFAFFNNFVFENLNEYLQIFKEHHKGSKGNFALTLVAAISTGYSLLGYVVKQEKQQEEEQKERLQSELSFLRSQISPHFIFNVLNSIVYLIRTKSDNAEAVTLKLSELMRYMLYETGNAQIALEQEIIYLKNYIELQKIRFEEDVEIQFNVKGTAQSQKIEPMLLIPFVENAFKHGVGMIDSPIIVIDLEVQNDVMRFVVKNKIAPETALEKDTNSGIGIKNVQRRLELLYPKTHQLAIKKEDGFFEITLHLNFN